MCWSTSAGPVAAGAPGEKCWRQQGSCLTRSTRLALVRQGLTSSLTATCCVCAVTLLEVVRSPFDADWLMNSTSTSTHSQPYQDLQMVSWDLDSADGYSAVRRYLEEKLNAGTMTRDPRYTGTVRPALDIGT